MRWVGLWLGLEAGLFLVGATSWKHEPSKDSGVQVGIGPGGAMLCGTF